MEEESRDDLRFVGRVLRGRHGLIHNSIHCCNDLRKIKEKMRLKSNLVKIIKMVILANR